MKSLTELLLLFIVVEFNHLPMSMGDGTGTESRAGAGTDGMTVSTLSFQSKSSNSPQIFTIPSIEHETGGRSIQIQIPESDTENAQSFQAETEIVKSVSVTLLNKIQQQRRMETILGVSWTGKGVIIGLLQTLNQNLTIASSTIFISRDSGRKFEDGSHLLIESLLSPNFKPDNNETESNPKIVINKIYSSQRMSGSTISVSEKLVLIDEKNQLLFTTDGPYNVTSFKASRIPFVPDEIIFEQGTGQVLFAYETVKNLTRTNDSNINDTNTDTNDRLLWVSLDFGKSWKMIQNFVKSVSVEPWNPTTSKLRYYVHKIEPRERSVVITSELELEESQNENDSTAASIILEGVHEFAIKDDYMFATKRNKSAESDQNSNGKSNTQLWISYKRQPFVRAVFPTPNNDPITNFHVAHISYPDGRIFICITSENNDDDRSVSNLYIANAPTGNLKSPQFTLSLKRIVFLRPNNNFVDHFKNIGLADSDTFADLHKVDGLPRTFIANAYNTTATKTIDSAPINANIISMVTFDSGDHWEPIKCAKSLTNCSLRIQLESGPQRSNSLKNNANANSLKSLPVVSRKSSTEIITAAYIIATGLDIIKNLGSAPGLYVSRDGGASWGKSLEGNYLYTTVSNQREIYATVAIKLYKNKMRDATETLLVSMDKGQTWKTHKFYNEKIGVVGLTGSVLENSANFLVIGSTIDTRKTEPRSPAPAWVLIQVDLNLAKSEPEIFPTPITTTSSNFDNNTYNNSMSNIEIENQNSSSEVLGVLEEIIEFDSTIFILRASKNLIQRIYLNNLSFVETIMPLRKNGKITALEFDIKRNFIYWTDFDNMEVVRLSLKLNNDTASTSTHLNFNSTTETLIKTHRDSLVKDIALDWMSQNLYICNGKDASIQVIKISTRTDSFKSKKKQNHHSLPLHKVKIILKSPDLEFPHAVTVHPERGYLFWTDWAWSRPFIGRSWLDGSHAKRLVIGNQNSLGPGHNQLEPNAKVQLKYPSGLAIDYKEDRLYWADISLGLLACSDLDGNNIRILIRKESDARVTSPHIAGVIEDLVYWYDWETKGIYSLNKTRENLKNDILLVMSLATQSAGGTPAGHLKAFGPGKQEGSNSCSDPDNAMTCSHFCFSLPPSQNQSRGYTCGCPDGFIKLQDYCYEEME